MWLFPGALIGQCLGLCVVRMGHHGPLRLMSGMVAVDCA